jgi:glycine hydroxymethyltransferase
MDEITHLIAEEERRQKETLMLIPSENYASSEVRQALGSRLTNKYSEGYAGKRYYQGNKIIDQIEDIAINRAKELFGVPHVNVQPYSGSPANAAALMAMAQPGETIMGLKLSGGGHLTHGHPKITFSGKFYNAVQFDVNEEGWIDYDEVERMAIEAKPKVLIVGTTAYPRKLDFAKFGQIADKVGAYLLADISHIAGLIIGGVHESPVPYAHVVMTTTHKTLRGPRGAMLMVTEKGLSRDADLAKKIDRAVFPGLQGGPHDNVTAAIVIALEEALQPKFKEYAAQIVKNAQALAGELANRGIKLTTGGTDNHLMVMDLRGTGLNAKETVQKLEEAGIVTNYNSVPHDTNPPANPSGIRLGTPAVTTRGMKEPEMIQIAQWISEIIEGANSGDTAERVKKLLTGFPMP